MLNFLDVGAASSRDGELIKEPIAAGSRSHKREQRESQVKDTQERY
jgi:hypothetical protein